jgi:uncharacterized DUF497 family protein
MRFEWDQAKNELNIRKHGIDFADVVDMFGHPMLTLLDDISGDGEERWIAVGWIRLFVGVVVYTERVGDVIRIISARKATKYEAGLYEKYLQN